jgi:hypothetical protein
MPTEEPPQGPDNVVDLEEVRRRYAEARARERDEFGFGPMPTGRQLVAIQNLMLAKSDDLVGRLEVAEWMSEMYGHIGHPNFLILVDFRHHAPDKFPRYETRVRERLRARHGRQHGFNRSNFNFDFVTNEAKRRMPGNRRNRPVNDVEEAENDERIRTATRLIPGLYKSKAHMVRLFNLNYATVTMGSGLAVAHFKDNGDVRIRSIDHWFLKRWACVRMPNPNPDAFATLNGAKEWLEHADHRHYDDVVFEPRVRAEPGVLNLWTGFGFDLPGWPRKQQFELPTNWRESMKRPKGRWNLWRHHVRDVICKGDRALYRYNIKRLAHTVQRPNQAGQVMLTMVGDEGVGKGTWGEVLVPLFGAHGAHLTRESDLIDERGELLQLKVYVFADESAFAGSHKTANILKSMATSSTLSANPKYLPKHEYRNTLHIDQATNEHHAQRAAHDSRRWLVVKVGNQRAGITPENTRYFTKLRRQLTDNDNAGYRAMLWDLVTMDLSGFDVRVFPVTAELARQRLLSQGPLWAWWNDCLTRGYVYVSKCGFEGDLHLWRVFMASELLHESYLDFARANRLPQFPQQIVVAWLREELGQQAARQRNTPYGERRSLDPNRPHTLLRAQKWGNLVLEHDQALAVFSAKAGIEALTGQINGSGVDVEDDGDVPF